MAMRPAAWRRADDVAAGRLQSSRACALQTYQYARRVKMLPADHGTAFR